MDFYFGKKDIVPISLGHACGTAEFIATCGNREGVFYERQVFDWLGMNMWAVLALTKNKFEDFLNPEHFARRKRFVLRDESWPTNTKYDIVFLHDFKEVNFKKEFPAFQEKYKRRVERYLNLMEGEKELLFIRVESDGNITVHCSESEGDWRDEYTPLQDFADYLKGLGTKYSIVYLTYTWPSHWDQETRICYVNFTKVDYNERFTSQKIEEILKANLEFVRSSLNKNSS